MRRCCWLAAQGRSVVFGTLMLSVMLLILANRDLRHSALRGMRSPNPLLWRMAHGYGRAAGGGALPALAAPNWMGLAPPGLTAGASGAGLLALCVLWLKGLRLAARPGR